MEISIAGQSFPMQVDARIPTSGFFTDLLCRQLKITPNTTLLDIGCGSGVIGIFALLQGARHVIFNDVQQTALKIARQNVALNQCPPDATQFLHGSFTALHLPNLTPEVNLVSFNGPTMPQELLDMSLLTPQERLFRDGGLDGLSVVRDFLDWYAGQKMHPACLITMCSLSGKKRIAKLIRDYEDRLQIVSIAQSRVPSHPKVIPAVLKLSPEEQMGRGFICVDGTWHEELYVWSIMSKRS